jgi:hypothetical protein
MTCVASVSEQSAYSSALWVVFGECEKVAVGVCTQGSLGHIYEGEKRSGDSGTLSRQHCSVPILWAAHLDRFGGEAGDQVNAPVRGCIHSPMIVASCPRCHVVEHRANVMMRSAKSGHYPGSE